MGYIYAGEVERCNGVTDDTHQKHERAWKRWVAWLDRVGLQDNPHLLGFKCPTKARLVGGFAISIRRGEHSAPRYDSPLGAGTVRQTLSNLASAFTINDHADPRHNDEGDIHPHLKNILRAFSRNDPKCEPQKAITPMLLAYLYKRTDNFAQHIADLCNGAFFFACRSCEYSQTKGTRKTKIITLGNIGFRTRNRVITDPALFSTAETVSITFVNQKNENNYETVTQHSNTHPTQNPVAIWASIYNRVINIPGASPSSNINIFFNQSTKQVESITADQIRVSLQWAAAELGYERLGYHSHEVGCHSIRSGAAMAMYLNKVPTFTIMLQGRWCSDAFLRYIRKQVKEFSAGVSAAMVKNDMYEFYNVPDCLEHLQDEDPRTPGNSASLTSSYNGSSAVTAFTRHHIFK